MGSLLLSLLLLLLFTGSSVFFRILVPGTVGLEVGLIFLGEMVVLFVFVFPIDSVVVVAVLCSFMIVNRFVLLLVLITFTTP